MSDQPAAPANPLRTSVYIDGFNLYYRALKGTPHKWLDVAALSSAVLPAVNSVTAIHYYTAHISGRLDAGAPGRQRVYLAAISSLPGVSIHYGNFQVTRRWSPLVQPPDFLPPYPVAAGSRIDVARVWKTEEKGSDVNLGVHLVRDAFRGAFDEAAVLTNDTDLVEPIRIVVEELGLPVTLLAPVSVPATSLSKVASHMRHVAPYLGPCKLPDPVIVGGKTYAKPPGW